MYVWIFICITISVNETNSPCVTMLLLFRKLLAAACEKKSVMLFDPVTQKYITSIKKAHNDCVNCIK